MTDSYSFPAKLEIIGINPYVSVPEEILVQIFSAAARDKSPIPVFGTVNGLAYKQNLMKYKGLWRLYINTTMLRNSPKHIGEILVLTIAFDPSNRAIEQPSALTAALKKNPEAKTVFDTLIPSRQLEINRYITHLKSEEAITRNVERAIHFLLGKERFVGRDRP